MYNFTSGTSYAAPHVSGAAALLLQKNPDLLNYELRSLLLTTTEPVSDAYDQAFSISEAGSGRLDIGNAFGANLIIMPPNFVVSVSIDDTAIQQNFELKLLDGTMDGIEINFDGPEFIEFSHVLEGNNLQITMNVSGDSYGDHEGKLIINHQSTKYTIPYLLHYTQGSVFVNQQDQKLFFEINHPQEWSFAKISVINSKDGKVDTTTISPDKNSSIKIYENTQYWIDAKIRVNGTTFDAYNTIQITTLDENPNRFEIIDIPEKQIGIIAGIVIIVGIIGLIKRR